MANTLKFGNGQWYGKAGSILAYNDENNNYKPLPFTFTRASSATIVNESGLIESVGSGIPRVDYLNNADGHLLLEPSRTNVATYSENIPTNFVATDITGTFEYGVSPNGLTKSTRLQLSNLGSSRYVYTLTGVVSSGTTYTFSCYYKGNVGETAYIYALPVGGTDVSKEITFTGEWQREYVTFTAGASSNYVYIVDSRKGGTATDFQVWGTQIEAGSYATSYIPTSGSSVTRVADTLEQFTTLLSGSNNMAMFVDYKVPSIYNSNFRNQIGFRDNGNADFYFIQFPSLEKYEFRYRGVAGVNVDVQPTIASATYGLRKKILFTKTGTTLKVFCNGVEISTITNASATTFSTTSEKLHISNNYPIEAEIIDWRLYNNGLTDSEAISLTSL